MTVEQAIWQIERGLEEYGRMGIDTDEIKKELVEKWSNE